MNVGSAYDGLISTIEVQRPAISDHNLHLMTTRIWRDNARNVSDRLDKQMIRSQAKKHSYKFYKIDDKVHVRSKKEKQKKKSMKQS